MSQQEPSEDELRAALEEQMRRITVQDVLIQTVVTLINLGGRRLGLAGPPEQAGEQDLEQARLAIEGARALVPLLPQEAELGPVRDALSQLQMAYAQLAAQPQASPKAETAAGEGEPGAEPAESAAAAPGEAGAPASDQSAPGPDQAASQPKPSPAEEAERAKARSKIWTPPGT
jgi:hypothetical protein